jgi:hypothetical protein
VAAEFRAVAAEFRAVAKLAYRAAAAGFKAAAYSGFRAAGARFVAACPPSPERAFSECDSAIRSEFKEVVRLVLGEAPLVLGELRQLDLGEVGRASNFRIGGKGADSVHLIVTSRQAATTAALALERLCHF